jgi:hypothetical protein
VDYFTVKIGYKFWNSSNVHWFFVTLGADTALHLTLLILTQHYLFGLSELVMIPAIFIIWLHFTADFILQSEFMAKGKSKSNKILLYHVSIYSIPFILIGPLYAAVNGALHFVVDYITARMTTKYWEQKRISLFFNVIGFDQVLHFTILMVTYNYMFLQ